jgi:hypothetical protein
VPPVCIITSAWCIAIESGHLHKSENAIGSTKHINLDRLLEHSRGVFSKVPWQPGNL